MALNIRIPFDDIVGSRDTTLDKDALISNAFCDSVPEGTAIVKRPGLINKTSALGLGISGALGLGQGIFFFNNKVYSWNSIDPGTTWYGFIKSPNLLLTSALENASSFGDRVLTIDTSDNIKTRELPVLPLTDVNQSWRSLVYTGTRFILSSIDNTGIHHIFWSTDSVNWTKVTIPSPPSNVWHTGAISGTTIALLDRDGQRVVVSNDNGDSWVMSTTPFVWPDPYLKIGANNVRFTTGTHYSANGTVWTACTGTTVEIYNDIVWTGTFFLHIAVNYYKSTDGINWTSGTITGTGADVVSSGTNKIAYGDGKIVGVDDLGRSAYSTDGITWTLGNRNIGSLVIVDEIEYFNGAFYCLSHSTPALSGAPFNISFIEKSTDGINWTRSIIDVALFNEIPTIISGLV